MLENYVFLLGSGRPCLSESIGRMARGYTPHSIARAARAGARAPKSGVPSSSAAASRCATSVAAAPAAEGGGDGTGLFVGPLIRGAADSFPGIDLR